MKVLITGGAGYIGSRLVPELLSKGLKVTVLDSMVFGGNSLLPFVGNPDFEIIRADITKEIPDLTSYNAIVHLAALVFTGGNTLRKRIGEVNYKATKQLYSKTPSNARFIFPSTCSIYGKTGIREGELTEDANPGPTNAYAMSKALAEAYLSKRENVTILRLATNYGLSPRMRFDLIVNELVRDAILTKQIAIHSPDSWRPILHVHDTAQVLTECCIRSEDPETVGTFNIGSQNIQKKTIGLMLKQKIPSLSVTMKTPSTDKRDYMASFELFRKTFNYAPQVTLSDGIDEITKSFPLFRRAFSSDYNNLSTYTAVGE